MCVRFNDELELRKNISSLFGAFSRLVKKKRRASARLLLSKEKSRHASVEYSFARKREREA